MKVGFTGTRQGMTPEQKHMVRELLVRLHATELHHGDCIGADADAHDIAGRLNLIRVVHPPVDQRLAANVVGADETRERRTHFARNRDIVNETNALIATPQYADPITPATMGGTAYTVNYGRKKSRHCYVVKPDGTLQDETCLFGANESTAEHGAGGRSGG